MIRTKKRIALLIFFLCVMLTIGVYVYATYIEPKLIVVETFSLKSGYNSPAKQVTIAQFTDTQLGEFYTIKQLERAVEKINALEAEIIIFTGDLFDIPREYEYKEEALSVLKQLDSKSLKLAIPGNHDVGGGGKAIYEKFMVEAGFQMLINKQLTYVTESGLIIDFFGLDDAMLGKPDWQFIETNIDPEHYNILLIHEPDLYEKLKEEPIDLVLSGHSHGGQISLPFYGPLITPPLADIYKKGHYYIENERKTHLFVNTGLGNTRMVYRFGNVPKIEEIIIDEQ